MRCDVRTVVWSTATMATMATTATTVTTTGASVTMLPIGAMLPSVTVVVAAGVVDVRIVAVVAMVVVTEPSAVPVVGGRKVVAQRLDLRVGQLHLLDRAYDRDHSGHHVHLDVAVDQKVATQAVPPFVSLTE
jgi:hypothetical protein